MRFLWLVSGGMALSLGMIGVVLPLLPTVPFLLLATFCFARSSPRLHAWLVTHPTYGPHIRSWQESGAIALRAKRLATLTLAITFTVSLLLGVGWKLLAVQAVALLGVLIFIWTRPST